MQYIDTLKLYIYGFKILYKVYCKHYNNIGILLTK